ncbi:MAG: SDR family oxidoreductase [Planctomycetales bacterium]|nr:SDR family oxidoreductase [Planctomycetales bacterium]
MDQELRAVLITGATSGIGLATAEMLSHQGFRVFAGTRRPLEAAASEPRLPNLTWVQLDVTSPTQVEEAIGEIAEQCPEGLYGLVNNAGQGPPGALELTCVSEARQLLEVNTLGPLRLIQECLPLLRRRRGRIVNISSMNGAVALPMVGAYSASKFALEALSDSLRIELRPWGIEVSVIRPGQVSTAIFDKARTALAERQQSIPAEVRGGYHRQYERANVFNERGAKAATSPKSVAKAVSRALNVSRPRACYYVGFDAWGMRFAQTVLPRRLFDAILAHVSGAGARGVLSDGASLAVEDVAKAERPHSGVLKPVQEPAR